MLRFGFDLQTLLSLAKTMVEVLIKKEGGGEEVRNLKQTHQYKKVALAVDVFKIYEMHLSQPTLQGPSCFPIFSFG